MNSIQEKFKKITRNQIIAFIIFAITMYGCFNTLYSIGDTGHKDALIITIVAVTMTIGFSIFTFKNWRCPNCNKFLGRFINKGKFIKSCKSCGEELV